MSDYTDIQPELDDFENAVYGEEVRDSMISAIKKIHDIADRAAGAPDASSATAGQAPIADGAGGWAWGDVESGGISTESANLLCNILGECLTGTDQTANIASLRALLTGSEPSPDPPVTTTYTVTNNLTNASSSNSATSVNSGSSYSATLTGDSGYLLTDATVTMGGVDITTSAVSSTGRNTLNINIASVTGAVVITAAAEVDEPVVTEVTMVSKGTSYNCAIYSDDGSTALLSAKSSTTYVSDETFAEDTQVTITITYGANENTNLKQWAASTLDANDNKHGYYGVEIGHAQQAPYTVTYTVKAGHKLMIKNYNSGSWQSMTVTK